MLKASLPNEWSYELAEEVVRDYVQRNFVDKGMRPITENGEWGTKQKKIYDLDENGEKIPVIDKKTGKQKVDKRNRKQWKCQTVESTDWNSQENAKMWRKDLADTINATNEQLGIAVHWEHRSFKEQAKEMLMLAKQELHSAQYATYKSMQIKNAAVSREQCQQADMEVMEMIAKERERKGRLDLPVVSGNT